MASSWNVNYNIPPITSIKGLQNLTGLVNFYADWNSLTSVNLSNLTNLVIVDISDQNDILTSENCLTSVILSGSTAIERLRLDDNDFSAGAPDISALTSLLELDMDQCQLSGVIDLSMFPDLTYIDLNGNINITSVTLSEQLLTYVDLSDNALTQECVDDVLMWLDGSGVENGSLYLDGGTNASPTVQGIDNIISLVGKGWNVNYNIPPTTQYFVSDPPAVGRDCNLSVATTLYALESNPANVTRFYPFGDLTALFLGDNTSFYSYATVASPLTIYTANISSTTGVLSNELICS